MMTEDETDDDGGNERVCWVCVFKWQYVNDDDDDNNFHFFINQNKNCTLQHKYLISYI